jgi:hypothetical protein
LIKRWTLARCQRPPLAVGAPRSYVFCHNAKRRFRANQSRTASCCASLFQSRLAVLRHEAVRNISRSETFAATGCGGRGKPR